MTRISDAKSILTLDNGGTGYNVLQIPTGFYIIPAPPMSEITYDDASASLLPSIYILQRNVVRFFKGEGYVYGKKDVSNTGASVILELHNNVYVYIGNSIIIFRSNAPIKKLVSDVGNSAVLYDYAVDKSNNYYLLQELVVVNHSQVTQPMDLYTQFYNKHIETSHMDVLYRTTQNASASTMKKEFNNIRKYTIE